MPTTRFHPRGVLSLRQPLHSIAFRHPDDLRDHMGLTGHWTGDKGHLFRPDPIARLHNIQTFHMEDLGYSDIAYNGAFDADGNCFGLRDSKFVSAHAKSKGNVANRMTDGIVFLEDSRGWNDRATAAFIWWVNLWRWTHHGRHPQLFAHEVWAHSGGTPTECPGIQLRNVIGFCGGHV